MCLDDATVQKCKDKPGVLREYNGYWCSSRCPVCWVFAHEGIQNLLFTGNTFKFGNVGLLLDLTTVGCRLAKDLVERLVLTIDDGEIDLQAQLSCKLKSDVLERPLIVFTIRTEGGVEDAPWLGEGVTLDTATSYTFEYAVFAYEDDPAAAYCPARPANPDVASDASFSTARGWMEECAKEHPYCPASSFWAEAPLPTRVIVVGLDGGEVRLRASHDIDKDDAARGYAALSYVWGMDQPKTETGNLAARSRSLGGASLPQTIVDAIRVTRSLGIPYLWIDSLCILQDCPDDISKEISRMSQIYKSAIVTISAAKASRCDQGFFEPRQRVDTVLDSSIGVPFRLPDQDQASYGRVFLCADLSRAHDLSVLTGHNFKNPIDERAWTLQESWLSPRLLIHGQGPLQWKCLSGTDITGYTYESKSQAKSLLGDRRRKFFPRKDSESTAVAGPSDQSTLSRIPSHPIEHDLVQTWKNLVEQFSQRKLTVLDDKLPALSGIASEFHRVSHDDFYAGLWKTKMIEQLLWHHASDYPPRGLPASFRAPSWSWAAVEGQISFSVAASVSFLGEYKAQPVKVTIHSCSTTALNAIEPFGRVTAGELSLSGPMREMSMEEVEHRFDIHVRGRLNYFSDYIILDGGVMSPIFPIFRDDADIDVEELVDHLVQSFWLLELTTVEGPAGLVLIVNRDEDKDEDEDEDEDWDVDEDRYQDVKYKRVGYFRLGSREAIPNQRLSMISAEELIRSLVNGIGRMGWL